MPRGRYAEEFRVGQVFEPPHFYVTEEGMYEFCELTGDRNPLHDARAKKFHEEVNLFKKPIVPGLATIAWMIGAASKLNIWDGTLLALMNVNLKFLKPVLMNEALWAKLTVMEKQERDASAVIKLAVEISKTIGIVLTGEMEVLIVKKQAQTKSVGSSAVSAMDKNKLNMGLGSSFRRAI